MHCNVTIKVKYTWYKDIYMALREVTLFQLEDKVSTVEQGSSDYIDLTCKCSILLP